MGGGVALDGIGSTRPPCEAAWRHVEEEGLSPYSTVRDPVRAARNVNTSVSHVCVCVSQVCVCVCVCVSFRTDRLVSVMFD